MIWPLPALLAWAAAWALCGGLRALGVEPVTAFVLASLLGAALAIAGPTTWRRIFIGAGFPLSFAATGSGAMPGWAWLVPLFALALLYPVRSWRDAPVFPTPRGALRGLSQRLALPASGLGLDAGCGLGDALLELHREFPQLGLRGIEWSWPLRMLCALRCRFAAIQRADMWAADWSGFDLVYVFQRPESMTRVADKAAREMKPGTWLASLEFAIEGIRPTEVFTCADGRPLWLYRAPVERRKKGAG